MKLFQLMLALLLISGTKQEGVDLGLRICFETKLLAIFIKACASQSSVTCAKVQSLKLGK